MIRRILVPTDGSEPARRGVDYAIALAVRHGAALMGVHVVDVKLLEGPFLRDLSASLGAAPYVNYQSNVLSLLEERGQEALAALKASCREAGVTCETTQVTGIVHRAIVEAGSLADLIVMGRGGEHNEWLEGLVGTTTEAVVRRATQPVLVTGTATLGRDLTVLAYDGTPHARRAMRTAAAVAEHWKMPLHLLVLGGQDTTVLLEEAKEYLLAHDIVVEYVLREGDPGESIVGYAAEVDADLVIMGAYGHAKVREVMLGSTTTYVLNESPCPVLLTR